tara:strand:+ start:10321 stop:11655 length:1335 start_codon:yes stop_codon:yes gene_type:complete
MKITHIASATVLIEYQQTKILTDPWLLGEPYYGSWTHYPEINVDWDMFNDVDYIYISHIHPDHMSKETLDKIKPEIPILVHSYEEKFVKNNLERWGRKVIELGHGEEFDCGDGLNIKIYAADNCNPELCYKFFGCGKMEGKMGSTGIDTLCVIENGKHVILNVNDCPLSLSTNTINKVLEDHSVIDLLLVGYAGAGSYPQCWECYSDEEKLNKYGPKKKKYFLNSGKGFIDSIRPKHYMPFAGTYTLRGKFAKLEKLRVVPELQDALEFYQKECSFSNGILLNSMEYFDLDSGYLSSEYKPIDYDKKIEYVENVLSKFAYDYESDEDVSLDQILELVEASFERYDRKRQELNFNTPTNIYIYLPEEKMLKISCSGNGYEIIDRKDFNDQRYVTYRLDYKLLFRILRGPKYAHWNNAEIGSHIQFTRKPEEYERALYFSMNYFHC